MKIERCESVEQPGWLALRNALWPDGAAAEHLAEMSHFLAEPERFVQFVAYDGARDAVAFVEASLRHDCVNGTSSSPVSEAPSAPRQERRLSADRPGSARTASIVAGVGAYPFRPSRLAP